MIEEEPPTGAVPPRIPVAEGDEEQRTAAFRRSRVRPLPAARSDSCAPTTVDRFPRRVRVEAAVVALAVVLMRSWRLTQPATFVFDEVYYASDAVDLLRRGVEGGTPVHPPLGKWMIGAGVKVFGFDALGWRIVPLLCGGAVAGLSYLIGWRLVGRRWAAALAAIVTAFDGIMVTTGRLALLDGLVALWSTAALLALVDLARRPLDARHRRRTRWLIAVALGCGIATKWSVALLVPVAILVVVSLDWRYLPLRNRLRAHAATVAGMVGLVLGVYVCAYVPWLANYDATSAAADECDDGDGSCDPGLLDRFGGLVRHHREIADFHRQLVPRHPDVAPGWTWVVQRHPVDLFQRECSAAFASSASQSDGLCAHGDDAVHRVIALGNPVTWVAGSLALVAVTVLAVARRHVVAMVVAAAGWALWLPWLIGGRPGYTFYAAPLVPILGAATVVVIDALPERVRRWWWILAGAQIAAAVWLWPVWVGAPLSPDWVDRLLVLDSWES